MINEDQLYHLLDSKCQGEYDRFIARQLFERSDYNNDQRITLEEFVNTWLEAEHVTISKIQRENIRFPAFEQAIVQIQSKMRDLNTNTMEHQRRFVFRIIDFQGFNGQDPLFDISSNDFANASVRYSEFDRGDVVIDVDEVDQNIQILINPVSNMNSGRTSESEGKIVIPLSIYADMERHDKIFEVPTKHAGQGMIRMQAGIIYNQLQYFQKMVIQNEHQTKVI